MAQGHFLEQEPALGAQLLEQRPPVPLTQGVRLELGHERVDLEVAPSGPRRQRAHGTCPAYRCTSQSAPWAVGGGGGGGPAPCGAPPYRSVVWTCSNAAYWRRRAGRSLSSASWASRRVRTLRGATADHMVSESSWMPCHTLVSSTQTPLRSRSSSSSGCTRSSPDSSRLSASLARATCAYSSCSRVKRPSKAASAACAASGLRSPCTGLRCSHSAATSRMRPSMAAASCTIFSCTVAGRGGPKRTSGE